MRFRFVIYRSHPDTLNVATLNWGEPLYTKNIHYDDVVAEWGRTLESEHEAELVASGLRVGLEFATNADQ